MAGVERFGYVAGLIGEPIEALAEPSPGGEVTTILDEDHQADLLGAGVVAGFDEEIDQREQIGDTASFGRRHSGVKGGDFTEWTAGHRFGATEERGGNASGTMSKRGVERGEGFRRSIEP